MSNFPENLINYLVYKIFIKIRFQMGYHDDIENMLLQKDQLQLQLLVLRLYQIIKVLPYIIIF